MRLDPEGRLIVGDKLLSPISAKSLHNDESTTVHRDDLSSLLLPVSCSTLWERNAARLCQRVKEVQTLIGEDLREIDEPLTTLGNIVSTLSHEHITQWEAAKAAYDQALLECTQVLARILAPFTESHELIEQRVDRTDGVLSPMGAANR